MPQPAAKKATPPCPFAAAAQLINDSWPRLLLADFSVFYI
jgi:hypothetical protein